MRWRLGVFGAVFAALAVIVSTLQPTIGAPAPRVPAERLPADTSSIQGPAVFEWVPVAGATGYTIQVSSSPLFSEILFDADTAGPFATPPGDFEPGKYFWRYQVHLPTGDTVAPTWSFRRAVNAGPTLVSPADAASLAYPSDPPELRWEPVPAMGSYQVEWDDNPNFTSPNSVDTDNTSTVPPTLLVNEPTKTYWWRVRGVATDGGFKTSWSEVRSFGITWDGSVPSLISPTDAGATSPWVDQPAFEWSPVGGAAQYEIQMGLDEQFVTRVNPADGDVFSDHSSPDPFIVHATRYTPRLTYPAKSYFWRVRALDQNGNPGAWSDTWHFIRRWTQTDEPTGTEGTFPAARPDNVVVNSPRIDELQFTWDPVPGAAFYEVQVSPDPRFDPFNTDVRLTDCSTPHTTLTPYIEGSYVLPGVFSQCNVNPPLGSDAEIMAGDVLYVRVRAVDAAEQGTRQVYSLWSDQARSSDEPAPGPASFTAEAVGTTGSVATKPAKLAAPANNSTWADTPVLQWDPVQDAEAYLVAIALDRDFTDIVSGSNSTDGNRYFVTRETRLIPVQTFEDETVPRAYYWYVLPCKIFDANQRYCNVSDSAAINSPDSDGYVRSFKKQSLPVADLNRTDSPTQPWSSFTWQDELTTAVDAGTPLSPGDPQPYPADYVPNPGPGGVSVYEFQITKDTWAEATSIFTDDLEVTTSDVASEPGTSYRWRVRALDGGYGENSGGSGLPLAWGVGEPYTAPDFPGPANPSVVNDNTPSPCLTWDASGQASGYKVEIFSDTDASNPENAKVLEAKSEYPEYCPSTALAAGTYSWRVRSVNSSEIASAWTPTPGDPGTESTSVFTVEATAPVPTSPGASANPDDLLFTWDSTPGAAKYLIELSTDKFWSVKAHWVITGTNWAPAAGDIPPGDYQWRVSALTKATENNVLAVSDLQNLNVLDPNPTTSPTPTGTAVPTPTGTGASPSGSTSPSPSYFTPPPNYKPDSDPAPVLPKPIMRGRPKLKAVNGMLKVRWNSAVTRGLPVLSYKVYRSTNGRSYREVDSTRNLKVMLPATRGTKYWIYVVARTEAGRSDPSKIAKKRMPWRYN